MTTTLITSINYDKNPADLAKYIDNIKPRYSHKDAITEANDNSGINIAESSNSAINTKIMDLNIMYDLD